MPKCCGLDSVWVENVKDKGYHFCRECRNEVLVPAPAGSTIKAVGADQFLLYSNGEPQMYLTHEQVLNLLSENTQPTYLSETVVSQAVEETLNDKALTLNFFTCDAEDIQYWNNLYFETLPPEAEMWFQ